MSAAQQQHHGGGEDADRQRRKYKEAEATAGAPGEDGGNVAQGKVSETLNNMHEFLELHTYS